MNSRTKDKLPLSAGQRVRITKGGHAGEHATVTGPAPVYQGRQGYAVTLHTGMPAAFDREALELVPA